MRILLPFRRGALEHRVELRAVGGEGHASEAAAPRGPNGVIAEGAAVGPVHAGHPGGVVTVGEVSGDRAVMSSGWKLVESAQKVRPLPSRPVGQVEILARRKSALEIEVVGGEGPVSPTGVLGASRLSRWVLEPRCRACRYR